jgi:hypothetical protein
MPINPYRIRLESTGRIDIDIYSNRKQKVVSVTQKKQSLDIIYRSPMVIRFLLLQ